MVDNVNQRKTSKNHYSEAMSAVFKYAKDIRPLAVLSTLAYEQSVVSSGKTIE